MVSSPKGINPLVLTKRCILFNVTETEVRMGEMRGVCTVLVGKPEGKRQLRKPRRRWENNIKVDLQEVGCVGMDWIELAQDRDSWRALVNAVTTLRIP